MSYPEQVLIATYIPAVILGIGVAVSFAIAAFMSMTGRI